MPSCRRARLAVLADGDGDGAFELSDERVARVDVVVGVHRLPVEVPGELRGARVPVVAVADPEQVEEAGLAGLVEDLPGRPIPAEAHGARGAERARERAGRLGGGAPPPPPVPVGREHRLDRAAPIADRAVWLVDGRVTPEGSHFSGIWQVLGKVSGEAP